MDYWHKGPRVYLDKIGTREECCQAVIDFIKNF